VKPYKLQIEFDFEANESDLEGIEAWVMTWFQIELDTWNENSPILHHAGGLNVDIKRNENN